MQLLLPVDNLNLHDNECNIVHNSTQHAFSAHKFDRKCNLSVQFTGINATWRQGGELSSSSSRHNNRF